MAGCSIPLPTSGITDMSLIGRLLKPFIKPEKQDSEPAINPIPTVKFDPSSVSEGVRADLRRNIGLIDDVDKEHF